MPDKIPMKRLWKGKKVKDLFRTELLEIIDFLSDEVETMRNRKCINCSGAADAMSKWSVEAMSGKPFSDPTPTHRFRSPASGAEIVLHGDLGGTIEKCYKENGITIIDKAQVGHVNILPDGHL